MAEITRPSGENTAMGDRTRALHYDSNTATAQAQTETLRPPLPTHVKGQNRGNLLFQ